MKNLTPERREELRNWAGDFATAQAPSLAELQALIAAMDLLDAALAENRAWRKAEHLRKDEPHAEFMTLADARSTTDTIAARLGWEQEGR